MKYRKKSVVIMAVQYTGDNIEEVVAFVGKNNLLGNNTGSKRLAIATKRGAIAVADTDWIIRDQFGDFLQIDDEKFTDEYETAD